MGKITLEKLAVGMTLKVKVIGIASV